MPPADAGYSVAVLLAEAERRFNQRKLWREYKHILDLKQPLGPDNVGAYPWQAEFHNAGAANQERLLIAGNRTGKTSCAAAETACHLIGEYPKWWKGKKFDRPTRGWVGSESWEASRDIVQAALLGKEGQPGTGWIPARTLVSVRKRQAGVAEVAELLIVRHKSGGYSTLSFKSYEQERAKWQGAKLDFVWLDEEPPMSLYTEAKTRLLDSGGILYITFTPLLGETELVKHFLNREIKGTYFKNVTWDDAPHLTREQKDQFWSSYPEYERATRSQGMPMLGTGAVFPLDDSEISIIPFEIPPHFYRINGVDFGIDHPGAGAHLAWDKDNDTIYVYDCYKQSGQTPIYHVSALHKHGKWIPNAWPLDGMQRDKGSGIALKDLYRNAGAYMLNDPAHYPDERGRHVEPGVIEMLEYMRTNRFRVFKNLSQWFEEKRSYHREDGKIVTMHDDIMAATRYAFIMRRYAIVRPPRVPIYKGPRKPIVGWNARLP